MSDTDHRDGEALMQRFAPLFVGTQYYRAPTPLPEDWEHDLDMIAAGGLDGVQLRLQWRWMEARRGQYRFDDHDRLLELCAERGLGVIVKFIAETAPDYVFHELGGTRVDFLGNPILPRSIGSMYVGGWLPDFDVPAVMAQAEAWVTACVERYKQHDAVLAWHLWNEPRSRPAMDHAGEHGLAAFRAWLAERYGDIDAFNAHFGFAWEAFERVAPSDDPTDHALWFLWRRFCAVQVTRQLRRIRAAVHAADRSRPCLAHAGYNTAVQDPLTDITDDVGNASTVERYGTSLVDFAGDCPDFHLIEDPATFALPGGPEHMYMLSMQCDWMRAANAPRSFWVNEIYGNAWHGTLPDLDARDLRWRMCDSIARGADGLLFWQFREERFANELSNSGLIHLDGQNTPRWDSVVRTRAELETLEPFLAGYRPAPAPIAIHHDPDSNLLSAIADRPGALFGSNTCHYDYLETLKSLYAGLWHGGVTVDFTRPGALPDPQHNPVWIVPDLRFADDELAAAMRTYVEAGGVLIAGPRLGERDDRLWLRATVPGVGLHELFGARQEEYPKRRPGPAHFTETDDAVGPLAGALALDDAEALLHARREDRDDFVIASIRRHGAGAAVLCGFCPGRDGQFAGTGAVLRVAAGFALDDDGILQIAGEEQDHPNGRGRGRLVWRFLRNDEQPLSIPGNEDLLIAADSEGSRRLTRSGDVAVSWRAAPD